MRIIGAQGDSSGAEGILVRKHDWESTTKKSANRSWDKVCTSSQKNVVVFSRRNCQIIFFVIIFQIGLCCGS